MVQNIRRKKSNIFKIDTVSSTTTKNCGSVVYTRLLREYHKLLYISEVRILRYYIASIKKRQINSLRFCYKAPASLTLHTQPDSGNVCRKPVI